MLVPEDPANPDRVRRLWRVWGHMIARCSPYATNESDYRRYYKRGIRVDPVWSNPLTGLSRFYDDMSPSYLTGYQLDRIDNDSGYCASNCRWVDRSVNVSNRECTLHYTLDDGRDVTLGDVTRELGVPRDSARSDGLTVNAVRMRLRRGWRSIERLGSPPRG